MIAYARQQASHQTSQQADRAADGGRPPRDLIEGYDLLDELHRGGQGVVYRAIQRSTGRAVAVKVLVHGAFATTSERRRFEREVEILARLDVPGIVRIVDSGVSSGRWWFAMDLIEGVPLDRVPRERRAVLELLRRIAEAVHAAHLRGVLHRDLKPRNILVDAAGAPHILDFGLAREVPLPLDATREPEGSTLTEAGQFVGSLPWASPEQVAGGSMPIDLRTDIYSLGVILYQLLTDRFPSRITGPLHAVTKAIADEPPLSPRAIDPSIDRDLETVVLTCLRKDPARRYQSAAALAADLASCLRGEPPLARRDSLASLLRLWIARHRTAAASAAGVLTILLLASITTTALWRSATTARANAEAEARTSAAVLDFLERAIGSADPGITGGRAMTVAELLEQARRELDADAGRGEPRVEAAMRHSVAHLLRQLGRFDEAAALAESAIDLREPERAKRPLDLGRSLLLLSTIRRQQGRVAEASELAERGMALVREAHGGADHEDLAAALVDVAWSTSRSGDAASADELLRQAIAMLERLVPGDDPRLLTARLNRMILSHGSATPAECEALVAALRRRLGPRHETTIAGIKMLAVFRSMGGDADGAIALLEEACEATRAIYGPHHPLTIDTLLTRADLVSEGRGPAAGAALLAAHAEDALRAYGADSMGWARFQARLGSLLAAGDPSAAESWLRGALATFARSGATTRAEEARALVECAVLLVRRGATDEAEALALGCVAIPDEALAADHWTRAQAMAIVGRLSLDRGALPDAERWLLAAERALRREPARNARPLAGTIRALAELYEAWQRSEPTDARNAAAERWKTEAAALGR